MRPWSAPVPTTTSATCWAEALRTGADLVVLPELCGPSTDDIVRAIAASAHADALVVTTVVEGGTHVGLVVGADGVRMRQPQLHTSARHEPWATASGEEILVLDAAWGRLAVVVGDDALYPETFRLAALRDADVVAVPFTRRGRLRPRPAAPRASRGEPAQPRRRQQGDLHGAGGLIPLSADFTLWTEWSRPFAGVISRPEPLPATAPVTVATLRPACAANRFVTRGTDLVDGRPWALAGVLSR